MIMVERVARAIWVAFGDLSPWEIQSEEVKDQIRKEARAAIAAMREPTPAMIQAGYDAPMRTDRNLGEWKYNQCRVDYEAMIDAALSEP